MRRGDVRWYTFDRPDKSRPVVILTRDSIIPHIGEVTVAPVTSTIRDIPSEVLLDPKDGVAKECVVNCDHLQTIAKGRIGGLLTRLSTARMREVRVAVTFALSLNE
ncbi:MAG: type II toxin-antitoxin system PemK/MazF family toxin [Lentisphaerota bacterium]|jgi:mRNA interferase MazF